MKIDKILEYQEIDQNLLALEMEVKKSKEMAQLQNNKQQLIAATETINRLNTESNELLTGYNKIKEKIDALKAKLDEFDGIIEGIQDVGESDYYIKQIGSIADEIGGLEKEIARDAKKIDMINYDYNQTMEQGRIANENYKNAKIAFDNFKKERQPKVAEIMKKLDILKSDISEKAMEIYFELRQARILPAFVACNHNVQSCGRCFMDIASDTKSKLKKSGDFAECPNCRRILFIPNSID